MAVVREYVKEDTEAKGSCVYVVAGLADQLEEAGEGGGAFGFLNRPQWIAMAWDVWQAPAAVMVEKPMRYFRKDFLSWVMRVSA